MAQAETFTCGGCGKQYAWKPQLAGKKVRCKCGHVMPVPAPEAQQPDDMYALAGDHEEKSRRTPQPGGDGGMRCPSCQASVEPGAVICLACGMNFKTGKRMQTSVGGPDLAPAPRAPMIRPAVAVAGGASVAGAAPPTLGYARVNPQAAKQSSEQLSGEMQNLKWPIVMVVVGLIAMYGAYLYEGYSLTTAAIILPISLIIDMVLIFAGAVIACKLLNFSLGSPAEAVLKICAVALIPAAVSSAIETSIGGVGAFLGWAVALGFYFALLMWFFEIDGTEVIIMAVIIWFVRTIAGAFIFFLLFASLLDLGSGGGPMAALGGGGAAAPLDTSTSPAGVMNRRAQKWLVSAGTEEANDWLAQDATRVILNCDRETSVRVVRELYDAGAVEVYAANVYTLNGQDYADKLVIELPDDPQERARIVAVNADFFSRREAGTIIKDNSPGQRYVIFDFDENITE